MRVKSPVSPFPSFEAPQPGVNVASPLLRFAAARPTSTPRLDGANADRTSQALEASQPPMSAYRRW